MSEVVFEHSQPLAIDQAPTPPVIDVRGLTVYYNGEPAIENITFDIQAGSRVAIIGPNGAGKSTLMKAIMGLLQPRAGSIALAGNGRNGRQRLGYVPQNEEVNWDFPVTVRDVVMMGRIRQIGWLRWPGRQQWRAVDKALQRVQMADFAGRQIGELSGGQRRRVFIARALAQEADILLLDEPFSGVDVSAQASLMSVLEQLHGEGLTIILSTHDLSLAFQYFDQVMALKRRLIAYDTPQAVYTPATLAQLYGSGVTALEDGQLVTVFVDEHPCQGC